jgi:hypothetical protein
MSRDPNKQYKVTAPYVTMESVTDQGRRVQGYADGAPVPNTVPDWQFDHLFSHGLIAAQGEQPVNTVGQSAEQRARQALAEVQAARTAVAEAQARLDNALADQKSADAELAEQRKAAAAAPVPVPDQGDGDQGDGGDKGAGDGGKQATAKTGTTKSPAGGGTGKAR